MNIKPSKITLFNNLITFQLVWFVSAYWHNNFAVLFSVGLLAWLYYFESWSKPRLKLTLQIALTGMLVDSLLVYFGLIRFEISVLPIPFWFVMLWVLFATTCSMSLLWMIKKPVIAIIAGAVFGPLSYWAGMKFDAMFISGVEGFLAIAIAWASMMWLFSYLYQQTQKITVLEVQSI